MLTVAVVDDEWLSAECLVDMLKTYHQPFKTLSFTDADQALKLFAENRPDILFVDIRMPRMSGFELIDQVTDTINPDIIPIIVSGYQDIQYYHDAIQREVVDYILKPVKAGDLSATLDRAIERCNKKTSIKKHTACYIRNEKRKIYDQLTEKGAVDLSGIDSTLHPDTISLLQMIKESGCRIVSVISESEAVESHMSMIGHILARSCNRLEAYQKNRTVTDFIMAGPAHSFQAENAGLSDGLLPAKLRIGVSTIASELTALPKKAREAKIAGNFGLHTGFQVNMYCDPDNAAGFYSASSQYENQLTAVTEACLLNSDNLPQLVRRLFDAKHYCSYWDYLRHIEQVLLTFSLVIKNHGLNVDPLDLEKLQTSSFSQGQLIEKVASWLVQIARAIDKSRQPDSKGNLLQTIEYIDHNFVRDISLDFLAGMAKVGRSYYCSLFRHHCGKTPVEYITEKRIRYACRLLSEGHIKVTEVSAMCGYPDQYYFHKIFKRQTGMTPGEYAKNATASRPDQLRF